MNVYRPEWGMTWMSRFPSGDCYKIGKKSEFVLLVPRQVVVLGDVLCGGKRGSGLELPTDLQCPFQTGQKCLVKPAIWTYNWCIWSKWRPKTPWQLQQPEVRHDGQRPGTGHISSYFIVTNSFNSTSLATTTLQLQSTGLENCLLVAFSDFNLGWGDCVNHRISYCIKTVCHFFVKPIRL